MVGGMPRGVLVGAFGLAAILAHKRVIYLWRKRTARVKLTYFNIGGLGEPIRYVLALSGVPFEDYRFASRDEFVALKPSLRFGQVPFLELNGEELFQARRARPSRARARSRRRASARRRTSTRSSPRPRSRRASSRSTRSRSAASSA